MKEKNVLSIEVPRFNSTEITPMIFFGNLVQSFHHELYASHNTTPSVPTFRMERWGKNGSETYVEVIPVLL